MTTIQKKPSYVTTGTVYLPDDSVQTKLHELLSWVKALAPAVYEQLHSGMFGLVPSHARENPDAEWWESTAPMKIRNLTEALNRHAPKGVYIGYGIETKRGGSVGWRLHKSVREAARLESVPKGMVVVEEKDLLERNALAGTVFSESMEEIIDVGIDQAAFTNAFVQKNLPQNVLIVKGARPKAMVSHNWSNKGGETYIVDWVNIN